MKKEAITIGQYAMYCEASLKFMDFIEPLIPAEMSLNEFIAFARKHNNWNDE